MNPKYADMGTIETRVVEECAEVIQAITKIQRFGIDNFHPDRPESNNRAEVLAEISDLRRRLDQYEDEIAPKGSAQAEPWQDARASDYGWQPEFRRIFHIPDNRALSNRETELADACKLGWRLALAPRPADAALRELVDALDESLSMLCAVCRILNPQHKDCTYCPDTERERKILEQNRAALASSPREDGKEEAK